MSNGTFPTLHSANSSLRIHVEFLNDKRGKRKTGDAAAVSEPEANKRGTSLISRRLHYGGLTKRKELWLCASGRFRMRSGMPQGIVVMRKWKI